MKTKTQFEAGYQAAREDAKSWGRSVVILAAGESKRASLFAMGYRVYVTNTYGESK